MTEIVVPRPGWTLRDYQRDAWRATAVRGDNACLTWHRRAGKDELLLNALTVQAFKRPASYAYMFPESLHARRAMWQAVNPHTGRRRILETFSQEMLAAEPNETEMRLSLVNGSVVTFFGSDNYDRMVGASLAGIISSEHALAHPAAYAYFSPMLRENNGWFWAISTPRGRNHFKDLMDFAAKTPGWFTQTLSIRDTGALTAEQIEEARQEYIGMFGLDQGEAYFQQEYEVSFNAAILGAYFAREMVAVRNEGRIDPTLEHVNAPVHRAWDLGVRDDTSIWWFQVVGGQVFILDCYSQSGAGVEHYAEVIRQRAAEHGWQDGIDFVPHDARVKEWGSGRTRVETMQGLGLNPQVVPMATFMDGIQAVRRTLPRCVFHSRCEDVGIAALEQYRREWDDEKKTFKATDVHDWAAHPAAAFRYLSLAWQTIRPAVVEAKPQVTGWQIPPRKDRTPGRITI